MNGVETEIKLLASPAMLKALRREPVLAGEEHSAKLVTSYFDTPDGALHHAGASLRLRRSDGAREQTFKQAGTGASAVRRGEWTVPATADRPDLTNFTPEAAAALALLVDGAEPGGFATVTVRRGKRQVRHGGSLIEVAFDNGEIAAAGLRDAICELELELVEGDLAGVLQLARALPLGPELRWSVTAKGDRAFALAHGEAAGPIRARDIVVTPAMSVTEAFRTVCWNCLDHMLGNYGNIITRADNEALHQTRVAIRRLRAALGLFSGSIDNIAATRFRTAFREAASALGEAREMHVLLEALAEAGDDAGPAEGVSELVSELTARRDAALALAGEQLSGASFQQLLFEFAGWIETPAPEGTAPESVAEFAARVLNAQRKKVKRAGRHPHAMSDDDLHHLRIKVKKLRYAVEFFAGLTGPDRAGAGSKYAKRLGKLQDRLGTLHDLAERAEDSPLFARYEPARAEQLHDALEHRLGPPGPARDKLVDGSAQALAKLLALPRWWQADDTETAMAHDNDQQELRALQIRLTALQRQVIADGCQLLVIFEGRDTAGKDGTIKHIVEHMSPRDTRVVALGTPSDHDRKAWYFQRWCGHLPVAGEIALFNRSWYNRAGVERVMGFCSDAEYEEFMETVVQFEQMLVHSGMTIIKYYLDISKPEQKRRLRDREHDPLKQWKISPIDKKALRNWDKYSDARNAMLARTNSVFAPWVVVKADDKRKAHLAVIRDLLMRSGRHGHAPTDPAELPDPATVFVYDSAALERGWLAQ